MRSSKFPIMLFSVVFGAAILMFFSYFFLLAANSGWRLTEDLSVAGDVANALGVFSALFSGLAAFGLLYTIHLQRVALDTQQDEINKNSGLQMRMLHLELLRFSIESEELSEVWSGSCRTLTEKQSMYINLILSHWETSFKAGLLSEPELHVLVSERMNSLFQAFWSRHRKSRCQSSFLGGKEARVFHEVVEEEYQHAGGADAHQE